jgi:hypothetical protein
MSSPKPLRRYKGVSRRWWGFKFWIAPRLLATHLLAEPWIRRTKLNRTWLTSLTTDLSCDTPFLGVMLTRSLRFFRAFSSVVRQMPGYNSQRRGTSRTLPKIFVLFCVLFVLCHSVYCLCVDVSCTTATGWQPNCSLTNISYYLTGRRKLYCLLWRCSRVYHRQLGDSYTVVRCLSMK